MDKLNQQTTSKYITLDWDDISINEAKRRIDWIRKEYISIQKLVLSQSPLSGFHVRISFYNAVLIAKMRRNLKDDGNRLVNDLLNRPNHIHDILWVRKNYQGWAWEEKKIEEWIHA